MRAENVPENPPKGEESIKKPFSNGFTHHKTEETSQHPQQYEAKVFYDFKDN
jgi:hypothetical protein